METSIFNRVRRDAIELLADARDALQRASWSKEADEVRKSWDQLLSGRLTAAVVGEFKRGKSTLLGALVEQPELFPVNVDIATSLVSTLEYGSEERVTAFVGDQVDAKPVPISRQQIPEYVTEQGNPRNTRRVQLLRIQSPIPLLETGLVLLDTPGAGGLNTEHTAVTYGILGSADVAVFVLDAMTPLTVEELSLLETVARQAARLLVVITKIDRVAGYETVVRNTRLKLDEVLGADRSARTPVIPVSSTAKLDWLHTRDEESLEVSNFGAFEAALWELLTEHGGAILVTRALDRLVRTLDDVRSPLEAELVALTAEQGEIDEAAAGLQQERDQLVQLAESGAGWRRALVDAFNQLRIGAEERLGRELTAVANTVDRELAQPNVLERAQAVLADLERDVSVLWSGLVQDLRGSVAELSDKVEVATGIRPSPVLAHAGALTAFESFGQRDRRETDQSSAGFVALGWLGEVLAFMMDDITVLVITQLASFFGIKTARAKRRREQFAEDVRDQLRRVHRELRTKLAGLLDGAESSVTRSFDAVIDADRGRVSAAHRAMRVERGDAARERAGQLRTALAELAGLRTRAMAIVGQVTGPDGMLPAA